MQGAEKMLEFAPGMRVIIRDEEWMIKKVERNTMGKQALHCVGISPLIKDREAIFLEDVDEIIPVDPAKVELVIDTSPHYREMLLYLESQWRQKIPTDTAIHIGDRAAMDPLPYQLLPAATALKQPRQRILIADDVGLGKTLEAGILMSELIVRGKGKRILVVTGKSMMTQFQKEMWNRFTIPLVRLDSNRIHQIRAKLPVNYNPFFYYDKTIISVDTLKNDVAYRTHLEQAYWDIIVIDEAQNVATRGDRRAQRAKLAELLAGRSDTMIMLSATPHDGRAESFASLMNMLDPTAIANPKKYTKDDIQGLCIRRFKKDVKNQMNKEVLERTITKELCQASAAEEHAYDVLSEMKLDMDSDKKRGSGQLFQTILEKALFSSPAACLKTIQGRLKKLYKKHGDTKVHDISALEDFQAAVEKIEPASFSRYQKMLSLLKDESYGWNRRADDDRIVIFTERVDTMEFLYQQLSKDLQMKPKEIAKISGAMSDEEQQQIVEDFGRSKAKVRILVASDVASEGLNLHYLSHRLIHFDLPWSLMVFQQRNGRIDRYGQKKQPDIRYLINQTKNEKIHGDIRLLEILIEKEKQAQENIGDPTNLLGAYSVNEEEEKMAGIIEQGQSADKFSQELDGNSININFMDLIMSESTQEAAEEEIKIEHDETLFTDSDYLYRAMKYFNQSEERPVEKLAHVPGVDITLSEDIRRRMQYLLPAEIVNMMKDKDYLRLISDKKFCMQKVEESQQTNDEKAWPEVQYLWPLNPIFDWVNDKASLIFPRDKAPLAVVSTLDGGTSLFLMNGRFPNRKSTPLVDEWFGLLYVQGKFVKPLPMKDALAMAGIGPQKDLANGVDTEHMPEYVRKENQSLLPDAITQAQKYLDTFFTAYEEKANPQIDAELAKLAKLETQHLDYQMSLFPDQSRKQKESVRKVETVFGDFVQWVNETMHIENHPYIRLIGVLSGWQEGEE